MKWPFEAALIAFCALVIGFVTFASAESERFKVAGAVLMAAALPTIGICAFWQTTTGNSQFSYWIGWAELSCFGIGAIAFLIRRTGGKRILRRFDVDRTPIEFWCWVAAGLLLLLMFFFALFSTGSVHGPVRVPHFSHK